MFCKRITCLTLTGMPFIAGDYRTQFHKKAQAISSALIDGGYRFGMLHVKAVDDTGHDRQAVLKVTGLASLSLSACLIHTFSHTAPVTRGLPIAACCCALQSANKAVGPPRHRSLILLQASGATHCAGCANPALRVILKYKRASERIHTSVCLLLPTS